MNGIFNASIFNNAIFNVGVTTPTRSDVGGPPRVMWGEYTTPYTPEQAADVRATLALLVREEHIRRGIDQPEPEVSARAVDAEVEARAQAEKARSRNDRKRAAKAAREAKAEREATLGAAYSAALEAAFARLYEADMTLRKRRIEQQNAIAIVLLAMH